jgi:hypothetical protein
MLYHASLVGIKVLSISPILAGSVCFSTRNRFRRRIRSDYSSWVAQKGPKPTQPARLEYSICFILSYQQRTTRARTPTVSALYSHRTLTIVPLYSRCTLSIFCIPRISVVLRVQKCVVFPCYYCKTNLLHIGGWIFFIFVRCSLRQEFV